MRRLPDPVARIGRALVENAGGYLRNTVYLSGVTCEVCATPIDGRFPECWACGQHRRSGMPVATRVGTVVYAVERGPSTPRDQTYLAMYGYKAEHANSAHTLLVRSLVALGVAGHWSCVGQLAGLAATRWTTVPGTRHPSGEHPLHALVAPLFLDASSEVLVRHRPGATKTRGLSPDLLEVVSDVQGEHVVVIDDAWVSGGSAQSVAVALAEAGAAEVSILAVARVLNPGWDDTAEFLRSSPWEWCSRSA